MTPLTKIENGILSGDWQLVCDGYNKITGKNVVTQINEPQKPVFNDEKASKKELYSHIKENLNPSIGHMKSFSIEELREVISIYNTEGDPILAPPEIVTPAAGRGKKLRIDPHQTGFLPDGRFFQPSHLYGNKKMNDVDIKPLHLVEDANFKKITEPTDFEHNPRDPPRTVDAVCVRCKTKYKTLAGLAVTDEKDTDLRGNCPKCQESVGRQ